MSENYDRNFEHEVDEDDVGDYEYDQAGYDAYVNDVPDEGDFNYDLVPYTKSQLATGNLDKTLSKVVERYVKAKDIESEEKETMLRLNALNDELEIEVGDFDNVIFEKGQAYRENVHIFSKYKHELDFIATKKIFIENDPDFETESNITKEPDDVAEAKTLANQLFNELDEFETKRAEINAVRRRSLAKIGQAASLVDNPHYEKLLEVVDKKIFGIDSIFEITKNQFTEEDEEEFLEDLHKFSEFADGKLVLDDITNDNIEDYINEENALQEDEYSIDEMVNMEKSHDKLSDFSEIVEDFESRAESYREIKEDDAAVERVLKVVKSVNTEESNESSLLFDSLSKKYGNLFD